MQELDHQSGKAFEGTRDSDGGANLDEDAFGGANVNLKLPSFVDGRVEQGQQALNGDQSSGALLDEFHCCREQTW